VEARLCLYQPNHMKSENKDLNRFLEAQDHSYAQALGEIRNGRKTGHWMWYIFPQIAGLGYSETAQFYAIKNMEEAKAYLRHPVLGSRLVEISRALLGIRGKTANQIMGSPDDLKLRSSMTLFNLAEERERVFQDVLDQFYNGVQDLKTLEIAKE
jgi:uncharacterized protein (DUF1810 family)